MIVVGAGIIGLACAWRLAQRGHRVAIFDARETGGEASWASAGMLAPGGEIENDSPLARMAVASLLQYPEFVSELQDASGVTIDYRHCGAFEVALTEAEAEELERRSARQSAFGMRSEPATYSGSVSARYFPDEQLAAPRDLTKALRVACLRLGISIREFEPVTQVMPDGSGVLTSRGTYRDGGVLIAAGAWSSSLRGGLPPTMPVRGHMIAWRPDRSLLGSMLRHSHTYIFERGGALIAGSSTEYVGFDRSIDESVVADIHRRASQLLPALASLDPVERWIGFRPGIEGGMPLVGRIEGTAVWTAFGHYRNGILLAPETARLIAESVG